MKVQAVVVALLIPVVAMAGERGGVKLPDRVNVDGGAIAIGHPLGMSGARLLTHLVHALRARAGRYGLATLCVGVGQGVSVIVEAV